MLEMNLLLILNIKNLINLEIFIEIDIFSITKKGLDDSLITMSTDGQLSKQIPNHTICVLISRRHTRPPLGILFSAITFSIIRLKVLKKIMLAETDPVFFSPGFD